MLYRLKEIRLSKRLTQEEVASKSGVARATISKIESGEEVEVKINTLESLAKALDCTVSDFLCC
ncbi:helix-turn-helix transcriptional regulator [uncultured Phascolarctobacterium sp.]|uniref:helix-turn-helix domain-containing protein n=1 Tax=uncultured Phascolarctobacterium sp. TaxID=512296 RepID=UPI002623F73E|nr:helix-turn-helix transcriptional regulator [uncultured Phascolarctobacterium sp.]